MTDSLREQLAHVAREVGGCVRHEAMCSRNIHEYSKPACPGCRAERAVLDLVPKLIERAVEDGWQIRLEDTKHHVAAFLDEARIDWLQERSDATEGSVTHLLHVPVGGDVRAAIDAAMKGGE